MKLIKFEHLTHYRFRLYFENGEIKSTDLQPLIGAYVPETLLSSAQIDPDWGCLEFSQGQVDIEPKTLYQFAH